MIRYTNSIKKITPDMLEGFFEGWPNPPSPQAHLKLLQNSTFIVLAIDDSTNEVIGFINAISDNVMSAYIPLLEVLPKYRKQGIGKELVDRIMEQCKELYMVDIVCDENLQSFYRNFGMVKAHAMVKRNFEYQSGKGF